LSASSSQDPDHPQAVTQQIQAEWLVNLGRKNAIERLSHLLCELYTRLSSASLQNLVEVVRPLSTTGEVLVMAQSQCRARQAIWPC